MEWLTTLIQTPLFWLMGVPILFVIVICVVQMYLKHKERMAMIERGIHPDAAPKPQENARA